jgi:hypothetical protein
MANKWTNCDECVDSATDYWQRPCFICTFGDMFHDEDEPMKPSEAKERWK